MSVKILCAGKGAGKTTFLREQVAGLVARGRSVGGIIAPAVFENAQHVGYDLIDLRRATQRSLARLGTADDTRPAVGPYRLDPAALAAGNAAVLAAVRSHLDVIVIDEIGPLEFQGGGWAPALEAALRECGSEQALVLVVRPSLADKLPARFPSPLWTSASRVCPPWPDSLWE